MNVTSSKWLIPSYEKLSTLLGGMTWKRFASKKAGGSCNNSAGVARPKHRGIKQRPGRFVETGTILVLQNKLRFHPGLNVGMGCNGTLFALMPGRVNITSEKIDPNMEHTWNQRHYGGRDLSNVYKKYFHVFPQEQHFRFKRIA